MNTRLKALLSQLESGKMKSDSARILQYIMDNEYTSRPLISDALGIKLQTVVARVSDLLDMGIIEVIVSGREGVDYEILTHQPNPLKQSDNAYQRKKSKYIQWKKRGVKEFSEFLKLDQLELDL